MRPSNFRGAYTPFGYVEFVATHQGIAANIVIDEFTFEEDHGVFVDWNHAQFFTREEQES